MIILISLCDSPWQLSPEKSVRIWRTSKQRFKYLKNLQFAHSRLFLCRNKNFLTRVSNNLHDCENGKLVYARRNLPFYPMFYTYLVMKLQNCLAKCFVFVFFVVEPFFDDVLKLLASNLSNIFCG